MVCVFWVTTSEGVAGQITSNSKASGDAAPDHTSPSARAQLRYWPLVRSRAVSVGRVGSSFMMRTVPAGRVEAIEPQLGLGFDARWGRR